MAKTNPFTRAVQTFSDVTKAYKAGEITKDQGYQVLETVGLKKGPTTIDKIGTGLAIGVGAVATGGALGLFAGAGGVAAGAGSIGASSVVPKLISTTSKTATSGVIESVTGVVGKTVAPALSNPMTEKLISSVGNKVTEIASNVIGSDVAKPAIQKAVDKVPFLSGLFQKAQTLALGSSISKPSTASGAQAAAFDGSTIGITLPKVTKQKPVRVWAWVLGSVALVFILFGKSIKKLF